MFLSYLHIAVYTFKHQPTFFAVKVLSLVVGLSCSLMVMMHLKYSLSYDRHFPNGENIYRLVADVTTNQRDELAVAPEPAAPQLKLDYPQIEYIARILPSRGLFGRTGISSVMDYHWAEPDLIDIFSLKFLSGNSETALDEPNSLVLNETSAAKFFPGEEALGQTLTLDDRTELRVTGVMQDLPENTHMQLQMIVSAATGRQFTEQFMASESWLALGVTQTYLTVTDKIAADIIGSDLSAFINRHMPESQRASLNELALSLQPLFDIHLGKRSTLGTTNNLPQLLTGLSLFAALILLASCVNFVNLTLSQIKQRHKEIGVRQALGAKRFQIVIQFLFESLLLTGIAILIVVPILSMTVPFYTNLTGATFTASSALSVGGFWTLPLFVVLVGIVLGALPILIMSPFQSISLVKPISPRGDKWLRECITVLQFVVSTSLILLAIAITLQIQHLNTMELGFNKDNLLVVDSKYAPGDESYDHRAMINELSQHPGILAVAETMAAPPSTGAVGRWRLPGDTEEETRTISTVTADVSYFDAMQLTLLTGRWFSEEFPADFLPPLGQPPPPQSEQGPNSFSPVRGVVITRSAAANFGFNSPEDAVGSIIETRGESQRVIGVIENFQQSGGLEIAQSSTGVIRARRGPMQVLLIRIDPAQTATALSHVDEVWNRHRPDVAISRTFFDQTFKEMVYTRTHGIGIAAAFASAVTVLISGMGLYALAFHLTHRRTKEIGIRKVMGATSSKIVSLLTWEFLRPVILACGLGSIAGGLAISKYSQQFSSRPEIGLWVYVLVTLGTLLVATMTVSAKCHRAANTNPVNALRYE